MQNIGFKFTTTHSTAKAVQTLGAAAQEVNKSNSQKINTIEENLNHILKNSDQSLTTDKVIVIGKKLLNIAAMASGVPGLGTAVDLVYDAAAGSNKPVALKMNDMTTSQHLMSGSLGTFTDLAKDVTTTFRTIIDDSKSAQTSIYKQKKTLISSIKSRFSNIKLEPKLQKQLNEALDEFSTTLNRMMDDKFGQKSSLLKDTETSDAYKEYDKFVCNNLNIKAVKGPDTFNPLHGG